MTAAHIFGGSRATSLSDVEKALATVLGRVHTGHRHGFSSQIPKSHDRGSGKARPSRYRPVDARLGVLFVLVGIIVLAPGLVVYFLSFPHATACRSSRAQRKCGNAAPARRSVVTARRFPPPWTFDPLLAHILTEGLGVHGRGTFRVGGAWRCRPFRWVQHIWHLRRRIGA